MKTKSQRRAAIIAIGILAIAGLAFAYVQGVRAFQIDDIREATLRYQFQSGPTTQRKIKVYFVSLLSSSGPPRDPRAAFLKRFSDLPERVAGASESSNSPRVQDAKTGERGLIFYVDAIHWLSGETVVVDVGYSGGGEDAAGSQYYLKKTGGKWVVEKSKATWIA